MRSPSALSFRLFLAGALALAFACAPSAPESDTPSPEGEVAEATAAGKPQARPNDDRRLKATQIVEYEPEPEVAEEFNRYKKMLAESEAATERAFAARSMVRLDRRASIAPLIAALEDPDPLVITTAIYGLHMTQSSAAVIPIMSLQNHPDPQVRKAANRTMGQPSMNPTGRRRTPTRAVNPVRQPVPTREELRARAQKASEEGADAGRSAGSADGDTQGAPSSQ